MRVHGFRGPVPPGKVGSGLVLRSVYPQQVAVTSWEAWLLFGSGLVLAGAWIASALLAPPAPGGDGSVAAITAYYRDHAAAANLATYLGRGVTAVALLIFAAALRSIFRRAESWGTPLSAALFAGGIGAATISLVQGTFEGVLAGLAGGAADPGLVRALVRLDAGADGFALLPLGLLVAATSVLVLQAHGRPRWLGWGGLLLVPVLAVAGWSALASGPALALLPDVALAALLCWVAAISVVMFRHAATRSVLLATEPEPRGGRRPR
jgi:hypothetical protein